MPDHKVPLIVLRLLLAQSALNIVLVTKSTRNTLPRHI
jgi:hypothetical protein